jgi:hypothetical protein
MEEVSIMKSVSNLRSYLHEFFWIFSQFLAIYFELFLSGSKCNSEIADMRGPPVSRRFPHRARLSARRCRAIKAPTGSAIPTTLLCCPSRAVASPHARPSRPHRLPCPKPTTSLSERRVTIRARHRRYPTTSAMGARAPSFAPPPPR